MPGLYSSSIDKSKHDLSQSSTNITFTDLSLCALGTLSAPPRKLIKFHDDVIMEQTETHSLTTSDECKKSINSIEQVYSNKYTKLISILREINDNLGENKNNLKLNIRPFNDNYAINLSPCTYLWDEAYEIIDDDDYEDPLSSS